MNATATGLIAGCVLALGALVLVARPSAPPPATPDRFALVSTTVTLPDDTETFPAGPGGEILNANCAACHSAAMVLDQPPLKPDQWKAEVTKMREAYKAPVADADVPAILDALAAISAARAAPVRPD